MPSGNAENRPVGRSPDEVLDDWLVLAAQEGEVHAFEALARRWHRRLIAHAYRRTAHTEGATEATQEAWLAIIRGLPGSTTRLDSRPGPTESSITRRSIGSAVAAANDRSTTGSRLIPRSSTPIPSLDLPTPKNGSTPSIGSDAP